MKKSNNVFYKGLLLMTIIFCLLGSAVYAQDALRNAEIIDFNGKVKIMKSGGEKAFKPSKKMKLNQGDRIITGEKSWVKVKIDKNKELKVLESSYVSISELTESIDSNTNKTKLNLVGGRAWVNINKKLNTGSKFEVKTPTAIMGVRGTKFYVSQNDGKTDVTVLEGVVSTKTRKKVVKEDGSIKEVEKEAFVGKNEKVTVSKDKEMGKKIKATVQNMDLELLNIIAEDHEVIDKEWSEKIDEIKEEIKVKRKKVEEIKEKLNENNGYDKTIKFDIEIKSSNQRKKRRSSNKNSSNSSIAVKSISLNKEILTLEEGANEQLSATVEPNNATSKEVTWKIDDPSIATVDTNGLVTGIKAGQTTLTVSSADNTATATCTIDVKEILVDKITLNKETTSIEEGATEQLSATIEPNNATNKELTWNIEDPSIATVDTNGLVRGVKAGQTTLTVSSADKKVTATCTIDVKIKETIVLNKEKIFVEEGSTYELNASIQLNDEANKELIWEVDDPSIVKLDEPGPRGDTPDLGESNLSRIITGLKEGQTVVTVSSADKTIKTTCTIIVQSKNTVSIEGMTSGVIIEEELTKESGRFGSLLEQGIDVKTEEIKYSIKINTNKPEGTNVSSDLKIFTDTSSIDMNLSTSTVVDENGYINLEFIVPKHDMGENNCVFVKLNNLIIDNEIDNSFEDYIMSYLDLPFIMPDPA
ncbi:Ig-like domain-containing protein [Tepidibacter hydrothermalis]|uniref:Ig-like domain-containing protein n=1 Tax=Tepidibacter hydrothermalis TaxID=3036126 RepID=A0ABY8EGE0_9FIRM|nr:Ig-like domain-containing protein [Tepidibacter hydrothermalis]WFD10527.1 Ig-like domain-containing protein [Tepidibacter hydrothermalis]